MSGILFNLFVIPFFYLLSLLPFPVLYLFSDFVYVVLYHIIGYRKDVVLQNLRNSFPEKTEKEINAICKAYYHYLCDLFLETFKSLTISKKEALKRCTFSPETLAIITKYGEQNQSVILSMGHMGNWEWGGNTFSTICRHQLYTIYHPIGNEQFDKFMYKLRTRFGTKLITMKNTYKETLARKGELTATAFIADQTPRPDNAYWTTFLNQDTPVFKGFEAISRQLNYPVIYSKIIRLKRGYYQVQAEVLSEAPAGLAENELTERFTKRLEKDIIAHPETWLWSHRRWKHKRPVLNKLQLTN
ncbi:MAG: lysophospholipid acyltransferase family protein [Chitinophagales bacterium]